MSGALAIVVVALLVFLVVAVVAIGVMLLRVRAVTGGPGAAATPGPPSPAATPVVAAPDPGESASEARPSASEDPAGVEWGRGGAPAGVDEDVTRELGELLHNARQEAARERTELLRTAQQEAEAARADVLQAAHGEARANREQQVRAAAEEVRQERTEVLARARKEAEREREQQLQSARVQSADLTRRDERLVEREERVDADERRLRERDAQVLAAEEEVAARQALLDTAEELRRAELERVAGLTAEAARAELLSELQGQLRRESALLIRDMESEARRDGERTAREIVAESIQRVASEQTAESVVSVLHLPSDEMKGRIIGREGRNIRTFESVTGVNLIIDDTPEAVLLSCFDPVRREVGRLTLEALVADGRIHPHRIEEVYERSRDEVEALCLRAAEDAVLAVGIDEVHPELMRHLGRLRYRTSYGQNVLKHLVECAHISGVMAAELRMDGRRLKRAAFLHDVGKALTHEVEGSHAIVGAELARRFGEDPEVVHAIEAHHNEVAPQTVEAVLVQACDACSGGRPGARRESLEVYVARLERIEEIASQRPGVEKVFAMQAGREIRVMVAPDQVDDLGAHLLAREVAQQIEDELTYPGQIRVTVVRETRVSETAH